MGCSNSFHLCDARDCENELIEAMNARSAENLIGTVITSPPYWGQRSYDVDDEFTAIGDEGTREGYADSLIQVFDQILAAISTTAPSVD